MKTAIDGPLRDGDGYSQATRGVIVGLSRIGILVGTEDNWHVRAAELEPEVVKALDAGFGKADIGIRLSQPDSGFLAPGNFKVCWSMWEFTEVPLAKYRGPDKRLVCSWPEGMNKVNANFVPCEFCKQLWLSAGCEKPVIVVPLGFDGRIYHPSPRGSDRDNKPFTFIISGTLSNRKNPNMVLEAFTELFANREDARLIMKAPAHLPLQYKEFPNNVQIINETWPHWKLAELYWESDVLVYPSQGEGFGLTLIEAMACGLPVITTGATAMVDYVDADVGWLLDYDIGYVGSDFCLNPLKETWQEFGYFQPRYKSLLAAMEDAFNDRDKTARKGNAAIKRAFSRYTWEMVAVEIIRAVKTLKG